MPECSRRKGSGEAEKKPERKRKGCKRVSHPKGICAEAVSSDVCSFILLA